MRVAKKNITRRLHHLLTFNNTPPLMSLISDPATEPLQDGTLRLFKLKEERFAIASHQQRNATECSHRADADCLKDKVYYFMPVKNVASIGIQAFAVQGKNALSIDFMCSVGFWIEMEDRRWFICNS